MKLPEPLTGIHSLLAINFEYITLLSNITIDYLYRGGFNLDFTHNQYTEESYQNAQLRAAKLMAKEFISCLFINSDLEEADLKFVRIDGVDFSGANLLKAKLNYLKSVNHPSKFNDTTLQEAQLYKAQLPKADFTAAKMYKANFTQANLSEAIFAKNYLIGSNFKEAKLTGTVLADYPLDFFPILARVKNGYQLLIELLKWYLGDGFFAKLAGKITKKYLAEVQTVLKTESKSAPTEFNRVFTHLFAVVSQQPKVAKSSNSLASCLQFAAFCNDNQQFYQDILSLRVTPS